jgi:DNA-binding NarL/FixJ family response regulator
LIAANHPLVRAGLREFLQSDPAIDRIGEAGTADEILALSREAHWDLVLLDIGLTGHSGSQLSDIIEAGSRRVLVTSSAAERPLVEQALRLGAKGYLSKRRVSAELIKAVHAILEGGEYIGADLATAQPAEQQSKRIAPPHWQLSTREFQIFCKLAAGRSTSSMARELGVSPKTISTYRGRIFQKMKFHANADLVTYAIRSGLVPGVFPADPVTSGERSMRTPDDPPEEQRSGSERKP